MASVDPDWWKRVFDETYLITDARSVCDDQVTRMEVNFLEKALQPEKSWPILDFCGGHGRHALEFARRGYGDVTVLDYSDVLIALGRRAAEKQGLSTRFVKEDARNTSLPEEAFKVVLVMASSFGYFLDESENGKILREAYRLLKPEGRLLLDLPNREYVILNFSTQSWHEAESGIVVCRQRRLEGDVIYCREIVLCRKKGELRDEHYCTRLYSEDNIKAMLYSAGFSSVTTQENFVSHQKEGDYGCMTNRMIAIATKE
ncbi:MAG: class I SAM-dependent methyltransferase [Deltaproteobacteria bacterium]|nr:class I SAM-dependent methyltransferase [Deltaproteobacteria bacterium]